MGPSLILVLLLLAVAEANYSFSSRYVNISTASTGTINTGGVSADVCGKIIVSEHLLLHLRMGTMRTD